MVLGVHGKTCNNMVYGELGRFPLETYVKKRAIGFWARILANKETKLSRIIYNHIRTLSNTNYYKCIWIEFIKGILQECELSNIWQSQQFKSVDWLKTVVGKKLRDNFIRKWKQELSNMTSCDVYINFKINFKLEEYLIHLPIALRRALCNLRTNNSRIPKVVGRFRNIPREHRYCHLCTNEELIGDEYHLLLECKNQQIVNLRNRYIPNNFTRNPSMHKCINLLSSVDKPVVRKLAFFLKNTLPLYN